MTKFLYSVTLKTPAKEILKEMVSKEIHHVYVVGTKGELTGVISSMDVVKYLSK